MAQRQSLSQLRAQPTQWWMNQQNVGDIEAIKVSQEVERERLAFQKQRFDRIIAMFQDAFGDAGGEGGFGVPSAFAENVALFQPGGQFGEGTKMEIERGGQQAIAAGQVGLAQTGMSSGTNVAGLRARVLADTALSKAKVEEQRIGGLSGALTESGRAELTAEQIRAQREAEQLRVLSSFG